MSEKNYVLITDEWDVWGEELQNKFIATFPNFTLIPYQKYVIVNLREGNWFTQSIPHLTVPTVHHISAAAFYGIMFPTFPSEPTLDELLDMEGRE